MCFRVSPKSVVTRGDFRRAGKPDAKQEWDNQGRVRRKGKATNIAVNTTTVFTVLANWSVKELIKVTDQSIKVTDAKHKTHTH